jgi:hypothetical protein
MDEIARQIQAEIDKDFPAAKLKHTPNGPGPSGEGKPPATTVSQDIDSLKAKLTVIARGIEMLKGQL